MSAKQTDQVFESLAKSPYFVDTTDSIAQVISDFGIHAVIARPRRWGKTLLLYSIELFCGLPLDEKGNIHYKTSSKQPFGVFTNLKVVTEDKLLMDDILYILRSKELNTSIHSQRYSFFSASYPEFLSENVKTNENLIKTLLKKKYKAARNCFSDADYETFCKSTEEQQKLILLELISGLKKDKTPAFYCLLKEFGLTFVDTIKNIPLYSQLFPQLSQNRRAQVRQKSNILSS